MRFFFYGTLLDGSRNPVAEAVHAKLSVIGPATVPGALHAVSETTGWFPALQPGTGTVHGRLYQAGPDFGANDLARLDAYEDFDPARPEASLYVREARVVSDGELAQVYLFNRPLPPGSRPIPGGDFRAWIAAAGLPQFTGLREA